MQLKHQAGNINKNDYKKDRKFLPTNEGKKDCIGREAPMRALRS